MMKCLYTVVILLLVIGSNISTIAPKDKSSKKERTQSTGKTPSPNLSGNEDVDKLTPEQLTYQDLMVQNMSSVSVRERSYRQTVLGYVTPWNNKGYDFAKFYGQKFDIISPVWYQLKRTEGRTEFGGLQDTDVDWIKEVRASNPAVKILPRLLFDQWTNADLNNLFGSELVQTAIVDKIVNFIKAQNFEGIVCEILLQIGAQNKVFGVHFLLHLGARMKQTGLKLIVPLPPPLMANLNPNNFFTLEDYRQLRAVVDYFNVMTYDYTSAEHKPGPVSPATWMTACMLYYTKELSTVERAQFLMGVNFYGYRFSHPHTPRVEPIVASQLKDLLDKHKTATRIDWDDKHMEHVFRFPSNEVVYYPTLHSIKLRLQLAEKLNVGVAIWDLGQGLDHFLDLF